MDSGTAQDAGCYRRANRGTTVLVTLSVLHHVTGKFGKAFNLVIWWSRKTLPN